MKYSLLILGWISVWGLAAARADEPSARPVWGIAVRSAWSTSRTLATPDPPPPYRTERVFPQISFESRVVFGMAPGSDRWFVGEQKGRVYSFPNDPRASQKDLLIDTAELLKREPADSP